MKPRGPVERRVMGDLVITKSRSVTGGHLRIRSVTDSIGCESRQMERPMLHSSLCHTDGGRAEGCGGQTIVS